ncbi:RraA family protein [Frigidibacter sp. ROC022]|uniref:RraA family protein n=1 Tax=Frigidibacter sp. ROC022 TaxID=2971796 RepID=UPI00215B334D|nr:RraA family protein [Frigidibacter sp. ROC022]MCR8725199.1 RraA family protein [Frigidibacter sp. ROC022]
MTTATFDYSGVDWDAVRRLSRWYTGDIHDVMSDLGLYGHLKGISLYGRLAPGRTVCGPAATVRYQPSSRKGQPQDVYHGVIDNLVKGSVIMVDSSCAEGSGTGELMSTGAKTAGAVATVVHGTVRDLAEVQKLDYPLFGAGVSPVGVSGNMEPREAQVTLDIGGVKVSPGDIIIADVNGVVVVPAASARAVADAADAHGAAEQQARDRILKGEKLRDIWPV